MGNGNEKIRILGIMSGSSLDGLDLALCEFSKNEDQISWKIVDSQHVPFDQKWKDRFINITKGSALSLAKLDYQLGRFIGEKSKDFIGERSVDFIASHGHTIFHYPEEKMTCQIGNGAAIAALAGVDTITDFRSLDIALGGQGAPIVVAFEKMAFPEMDYFINLGGIANITMIGKEELLAFDICPCNQLLNYLASCLGNDFDENGKWASEGKIVNELIDRLLKHPYFKKDYPKTLDNSYIRDQFLPILDQYEASLFDKLASVSAMICLSIKREIENLNIKFGESFKVMLSGGGAHNQFLVEQLRKLLPDMEIILPETIIIDYKEAIMMAYLGYLRINSENNVFSSVSGAIRDSVGGAIYHK